MGEPKQKGHPDWGGSSEKKCLRSARGGFQGGGRGTETGGVGEGR